MFHLSRKFLFAPALALLTIPSWGDILYTTGPVNGTITAEQISGISIVSDSFVLSADSTVTGLSNVGIWLTPKDTLTVLGALIISTEPGGDGTIEYFQPAFPSSAVQLTPAANYGSNGQ